MPEVQPERQPGGAAWQPEAPINVIPFILQNTKRQLELQLSSVCINDSFLRLSQRESDKSNLGHRQIRHLFTLCLEPLFHKLCRITPQAVRVAHHQTNTPKGHSFAIDQSWSGPGAGRIEIELMLWLCKLPLFPK